MSGSSAPTTVASASASTPSGAAAPPHWRLHRLPPFYTMQPVPGTWLNQLELWGAVLRDYARYAAAVRRSRRPGKLDGAAHSGALAHPAASCGTPCDSVTFFSADSEVFSHPTLRRRLPPDAVASVLEHVARTHPTTAILVGGGGGSGASHHASLLVTASDGGAVGLQRAVLEWVLEKGAGTTLADLAMRGAVFTIDELADALGAGDADAPLPASTSSSPTAVAASLTAVGNVLLLEEEAVWIPAHLQGPIVPRAPPATETLRAVLSYCEGKAAGAAGPLVDLGVALFNLDGSDTPPFQGVKIGGQTGECAK